LQSLARALKASRQDARTAEVLRRAIQIAPSDAATWYQSGTLTGSIEKMEKAIALDPDLPWA